MQRICVAVVLGCLVIAARTPVRAGDAAEAKRILDKAVEAHGGAARLAKYSAATWKARGTFHGAMGEQEFTGEYAVQFPTRSRFDVNAGSGFRFVSVLNGTRGWVRFGEQTQEMDKGTIAEVKENLYASWVRSLTPLSDKAFTLSPLGESKVGDRLVLGVKVSRKGHRDVQLYFDKATGLLAKSSTRMKDLFQGGKEVEAVELYSDYKEINGVKRPMKVKELKDGEVSVEESFSNYKLSEKLDGKLFASLSGDAGGKPRDKDGFPGGKGGFPGGKGGFPGGKGGFPGGKPGAGFGGFGMMFPRPGEIMPSFMQDVLKLSDAQKKKLKALQKEVDAKVEKILTKDQKAQLKKLREMGPGGFPGGFPGGQGGFPGGFPGGPGGFPGGFPGGPGGFPGGKPGKRPGSFPGGKPGQRPGNIPGGSSSLQPGQGSTVQGASAFMIEVGRHRRDV